MITAKDFILPAAKFGYNFYTGVPCSFLTPFINKVITSLETDYVGAASEGEAIAISAGAWLANRKTVVMCQNSGLGNCVNPLTSLNFPFRIPTLIITTWRGQPGVSDEPQHELMSQITHSLLEIMRIKSLTFPRHVNDVIPILEAIEMEIEQSSLPFGLVMEKGTVEAEPIDASADAIIPTGQIINLQTKIDQKPSRVSIIEQLLQLISPNVGLIATTGKCGRELFTLGDRKQNLYQVGSMGCALGMGLGVSLNSQKPVIVLDGDGAVLMKMGTLATVGTYAPKNLTHIILDNGVHDSTGGQPTVSANVNFAQIAISCGYKQSFICNTIEAFREAYMRTSKKDGPSLIQVKISPGSIKNLGRPNIPPNDVALRFKEFLLTS